MKHQLVAKKTSWFKSPIVSVLLLVCIAWGCFSVYGAYNKDKEAVGLRDQESRELADLNQKQIQLNQEIANFSSARGIEAEIRNRYRVERPGENLVIVVDNATPVPPPAPPTLFDKIRAYLGW